MRGEAIASDLPSLDAFDDEFGREPIAILHGQQRRRMRLRLIVGMLVAAAIGTVLALAWSIADEWQRPQAPETIATFEAEQESRLRASFWYSEPAALTFGIATRSDPTASAAPPRAAA